MERIKKVIKNLTLFFILIVLTFYIIFKDQDVSQIFEVVRSAKKEFILIAILCMCFYILCEATNIRRTLKALNEKTKLISNIKYALIGFFFSGITPAASGGQPMQIYFMHKDKISVANSTLALLINLTCMQIVTISTALFSVIFNHKYLNKALIGLFILGIVLNSTALTLLIISIFSKRATKWIIDFSIKVLKFFRVKNIEEKRLRFEQELTKYQGSTDYIKNNKFVVLKTLITTYFQFIAFYSISYWVYRAFGMNEKSIFSIITLQSMLYATVSGIPSPGAVGVSEGGFIAIFSKIYPENMINGAMILSRGINFYLFIALSAIVVIVSTIKEKKEEKNEIEENDE